MFRMFALLAEAPTRTKLLFLFGLMLSQIQRRKRIKHCAAPMLAERDLKSSAAFPRSRSDRSYRPDPSTTRCDAQGPAITESLSNRRTVISHHHGHRPPLITGCSQRRLCQHAQSGSRAKLIEQRIIIKQIEDHVLLVLFDLLIPHVQLFKIDTVRPKTFSDFIPLARKNRIRIMYIIEKKVRF